TAARLLRAPGGPALDYERLTFRRGLIDTARFAPDGKTVLYSAIWGDDPAPRVLVTIPGGRESRPITDVGYELAAVGPGGELLVLRKNGRRSGTLARTSLSGATPRDIAEDIAAADFLPGGEVVAARMIGDAIENLEMPLGHVVYSSPGKIES